jgi:hypothetical protein
MTEAKLTIGQKLALVETKLLELTKLRHVLRGLVAACDQPHGKICPIIEQLESDTAEGAELSGSAFGS